MKACAAHSDDPDTPHALAELIAQLEKGLGDVEPVAGLVFANIDYDHALLLRGLKARWPSVALAGCTTDGEGSSALGFSEDSVCALFVAGAFQVTCGVGERASLSAEKAAADAVAQALERADTASPPRFCLAFPESLAASAAAATSSIAAALGPEVPVFGGASADDLRFDKPLQFIDDRVLTDAVSVMLWFGDLEIAHAVGSGFQPTGHAVTVTRAEANIVHEVDGQPALSYYREYLGDLTAPSSQYPLAIVDPEAADPAATIRTPILGDPETGAVTFAGDVPEGCTLRFAQSEGREEVVAAATACVDEALGRMGRPPQAALFFSCTGRKEILGTWSRQECEGMSERLGTLPYAGFYCYGEIGPVGRTTTTSLHNQTFVCLLMAEPPSAEPQT